MLGERTSPTDRTGALEVCCWLLGPQPVLALKVMG